MIIRTGEYTCDTRKNALGNGKYGPVYLGKHVKTKKEVAIRVVQGHILDAKLLPEFNVHAQLMPEGGHENIVKLLDVRTPKKGNRVHMIMEYCNGGTLAKAMFLDDSIRTVFNASRILRDMRSALECLSRVSVIHRNISPSNILVVYPNDGIRQFSRAVFKLTDFSRGKVEIKDAPKTTNVGELFYVAPESIDSESYDEGVDIFSLGATLYDFLAGRVLAANFDDNDPKPAKDEVRLKNIYQSEDFEDKWSEFVTARVMARDNQRGIAHWEGLLDMLKLMLKVNPEHRIQFNKFVTVEKHDFWSWLFSFISIEFQYLENLGRNAISGNSPK